MNGSLASLLSPQFPHGVRERGASYFRSGRIRQVEGNEREASASIQGSRTYKASLKMDASGVEFSCSCPFFAGAHNCKHLWGLVLAAEERGFLSALTSRPAWPKDSLAQVRPPKKKAAPPSVPRWKKLLEAAHVSNTGDTGQEPEPERLIRYVLDTKGIHEGHDLILHVFQQDQRRGGGWGAQKPLNLGRIPIARLTDQLDRRILTAIKGCPSTWDDGSYAHNGPFSLGDAQLELLQPLLCATGRFFVRSAMGQNSGPISLDEREPWHFLLSVKTVDSHTYRLLGLLQRGTEEVDIAEPNMLLESGWVILHDRMARLDHADAFRWINALRQTGGPSIPESDVEPFLKQLFTTANLPPVDLPPELSVVVQKLTPKIRLLVRPHPYNEGHVRARVLFDYEGEIFTEDDRQRGSIDWPRRIYRQRNRVVEAAALHHLSACGFRKQADHLAPDDPYQLLARALPSALGALLPLGWTIEASGKLYRSPKSFTLKVASGTDWFDLNGLADFDGAQASLPAILKAIRNGEATVLLDDGSLGLLPEEWLRRVGTLAALGEEKGDHVRFQRDQALLLDALLAEQPDVNVDAAFDKIRSELRNFQSVEAQDAPAGFHGELRPYQREGLGWFTFLQRFGFGGCLADDMGLGKTVQVLALLEQRRQNKLGPSLVVVPRSLLFNWRQEAERFTPALRVLEHSGIGRARSTGHLADYDLILTTYGTLRRDAILLKDVAFDYVVLDEAQAIKNATTHSAKAARLLRAKHRLALSGTPVENHLGELWSLFEFLNPGMMGRAGAFSALTSNEAAPETRPLLARALRPFILRRTKGQVAKELPARLEQTVHCDLPAQQRKLYDELREYYRQSLLAKVAEQGMGRSKIMVLEALLRLRQAACHPGLIDKTRKDEESAKLSALIPQLIEVTQEGHKALVFSQFTSFLALVKKHVEAAGLAYEYLDGKTKDRQARVERFQNDSDCRVFLISLRAGGLGLNLTAAEYVFLLDPWWNPAVEAQAIDRAHRIGQKQKVFAYRLIARDTIEEKVLQLQAKKRDLASAILTEDHSILRTLTREDLELLLG